MTFTDSAENEPAPAPVKTPRLVSLEHRLRHAKDADGKSIDLSEELLFFLDAPPPGTHDRWQEGADLCEKHGIATSRMAVWRFYRAKILVWRSRQIGAPAPDPAETARLQEQARRLAAQRALEMLSDPNLTPGQLVGFIQGDNNRQKVQLARDKFNQELKEKAREEQEAFRKLRMETARQALFFPIQMDAINALMRTGLGIPPGNGISRPAPPGAQKTSPTPEKPDQPTPGPSQAGG